MILKAQMQTVNDKTVISGLRWYASDRYNYINYGRRCRWWLQSNRAARRCKSDWKDN